MNNIIEGMVVLEKTPITEPNWVLYWILLLGGAAIAASSVFAWFNRNKPRKKLGKTIYVCGILVMFTCLIPMFALDKETGRYTYECTLEDNIPANYIADNFNVISIENGVWTIQDKEK